MAQIVSVRIRSSNQNTILFNNPETRCRLAGSGEGTGPAVRAESGEQRGRFGCDARAAGEDVQGDAFAKEDLTDWAADGRAVVGWVGVEGEAFFNVPFHPSLYQLAFRWDTETG